MDPELPRVLFVGVDLSTGGGVNRVIRDLAVLLDENKVCQVEIFVGRSDKPPTYPMPSHIPVKFQPRPDLFSYLKALWKVRGRYDYAIGFWTHDNIMLTLLMLFSGTKVVCSEHSSYHSVPPIVDLTRRLVYRWAHHVTVLNRREAKYYSHFLKKVSLVPNPVPLPERNSPAKRENLILGIGHFLKQKNFSVLLEAFHLSGLSKQGWKVVLVGQGVEEPHLRLLAARLGVKDFVCFERPTSRLDDWYERGKIVAVTSLTESFSLVLVEAALHGLVPLAFSTDGPAYLLEDVPELLVPINDIEHYAHQLSELARQDLKAVNGLAREAILHKLDPKNLHKLWSTILRAHG